MDKAIISSTNTTKNDIAIDTFSSGYSCSQAVLFAFAEDLGIEKALALKLGSCFGGGMRMGATCGALTAALMVLGIKNGFSDYDPVVKAKTEELCLRFLESWNDRIGKTDCNDIVGLDVRDPIQRQHGKENGTFAKYCPNCISVAVELLETFTK